MRKIFIAFCFFALLCNCKSNNNENKLVELEYQNDVLFNNIGIGLVKVIDTNKEIELYSDKACKNKITSTVIFGENVIPYLYKPDYGILYLSCIEDGSDYSKIALNNETTAYLKKSQNIIFFDWSNFLKNEVLGVSSKDLNSIVCKESINGKSMDIKNLSYDDEIDILKVKGKWLYIHNLTIEKKYWVQWKNKNKLLVYFNLLM